MDQTELHEYQRVVETNVLAALVTNRSVLMVLPTGAGKTVIAASIALRFKRVLILAHRAEILQQARARLLEAGASEEEIASRFFIMSIQKLARRGRLLPGKFDLVIIDEAHHTAAKSYKSVVARYTKAKILGLTATPTRLDGKGLRDCYESMVVGPSYSWLMDAKDADGQTYLSRPRIFAPEKLPSLDGVRITKGEYDQTEIAKRWNKAEIAGEIVSDWFARAEDRPTILFAVRVDHAHTLARRFNASGVAADVIHGEMDPVARRRVIERFRTGEIKVLCNVEIFGEGFDAPWARCAILARPTLSLVVYLQQIGRIMRQGDVPPIVLDHAGNALVHHGPENLPKWSLDSTKQATKGARRNKRCPACGCVVEWSARVCAGCGHVWAPAECIAPIPVENGMSLRELIAVHGNPHRLKMCTIENRIRSMSLERALSFPRTLEMKSLIERYGNPYNVSLTTLRRRMVEMSIEKALSFPPQTKSQAGKKGREVFEKNPDLEAKRTAAARACTTHDVRIRQWKTKRRTKSRASTEPC